jgi:arylsulfatase A-like enzyme
MTLVRRPEAWLAILLLAVGACSCRRERDADKAEQVEGTRETARPAEPAEPPNLVLVTVDTTRADRLGCYGYFRDTSPNIDAFAAECVLFERCIVPVSTTLPTHTSMLTGVYPLEHGVLANVGRGGVRFEASPQLMSYTEVLNEAGYRTAAFVSAAPLKRLSGIDAGFAVFDQPRPRQRRAKGTNAKALAWLNSLQRTPYFLWVHYYDPHRPYKPPKPYDRMFRTDAGLEAYLSARRYAAKVKLPTGGVDLVHKVNNSYDGEIRYMDHHIGVLLSRLRARPDWDRTVVVLAGDHGEGLCQHGYPGHGYIYGEQLHAPLMIRVPGVQPRRVSRLVSAVDMIATLLGLAGALPSGSFLEQTTGRDVLREPYEPQPIFSQEERRGSAHGRLPTYTLTTEQWKYVYEVGGRNRLFHLDEDPFELHDVLARHPQIAEGFEHHVLERIADQAMNGERFQAGRSKESQPLDPEMLEQLRSLGYLD